jgi:hypothetical protein
MQLEKQHAKKTHMQAQDQVRTRCSCSPLRSGSPTSLRKSSAECQQNGWRVFVARVVRLCGWHAADEEQPIADNFFILSQARAT